MNPAESAPRNRGQLLWAAHSAITIGAGLGGAWFAARLPGRGLRPAAPPPDLTAAKPSIAGPTSIGERPTANPVASIHPLDRTD